MEALLVVLAVIACFLSYVRGKRAMYLWMQEHQTRGEMNDQMDVTKAVQQERARLLWYACEAIHMTSLSNVQLQWIGELKLRPDIRTPTQEEFDQAVEKHDRNRTTMLEYFVQAGAYPGDSKVANPELDAKLKACVAELGKWPPAEQVRPASPHPRYL